MKICICDDDRLIHSEIRTYLLPFFTPSEMPEVADFYSGEELLRSYTAKDEFDIIFLDIEMGQANGIETANRIRSLAPEVIIVFVSNHREYVFDAFRCEALHFLVKPIDEAEFADVFNRALHKYRTLHARYPVCWRNSRANLRISDITYIEGYMRKLKVHTKNGSHEHTGKISDAYEQLKPHGFVQIHQGFIVNMHYIQKFGRDTLELLDGTALTISGRRRPEALLIYDKYIQKWKW